MSQSVNKTKDSEESSTAENSEMTAKQTQFAKELNKLDSIRDILFGENMQQYQNEFDQIKSIIRDNQERTDTRISEIRTELIDKITALEDMLNARLTQTENALSNKIAELKDEKTDRKALASLFMDIAKKLDA